MSVIVIEDPGVEQLAPVTTARLAAAISCGSLRLIDWLEQLSVPCYGISRPYLEAIQAYDFPALRSMHLAAPDSRPQLIVSARLVPSKSNWQRLADAMARHHPDSPPIWFQDRGEVVAVVGPQETFEQVQQCGRRYFQNPISHLHSASDAQYLEAFAWPHEVVLQHMQTLQENLQWRIERGGYQQLKDGVFVAQGVQLPEACTIDVATGPVILEELVQVGPYSLLRGPLHLGRKCRVLEHASLKDGVAAGHTTKIGGEVEASIIEPYTNKQHHGFLGHSYVGSWVNLGAGTCTSDLKNTYGLISVDYPEEKVATGMQFLGCMIGDYSKSAINTSIFTGKWVGVCSALYGFVTTNVPSFTNYAKLFGQVATLPASVMIATQARMFARRQVPQRPCDIALIESLYEVTREERVLVE